MKNVAPKKNTKEHRTKGENPRESNENHSQLEESSNKNRADEK